MTAQPIAPRRIGRLSNEDREASTPTGRTLHRLESETFTISTHAVGYRSLAEQRVLYDAEHDAALAAAREIVAVCPTCRHTAGPRLLAAMAADEREDAVALQGDGLVRQIHDISRRIAGWIERACVALRGRRPAMGGQMAFPEDQS